MLTWGQIDKAIKWKNKISPYGKGGVAQEGTDLIEIPIFRLPVKTERGFWASGFSFSRGGSSNEPSVIIYKMNKLPGPGSWGGQYWGYGILGLKDHIGFKKLLEAYIKNDLVIMKKMLAVNRRKTIKATFSKSKFWD